MIVSYHQLQKVEALEHLNTFNKNTISFHMSVHIKTKTLLSVDLVALGVMSSIWVIRVILDFRRNPFISIFTVVYHLFFGL